MPHPSARWAILLNLPLVSGAARAAPSDLLAIDLVVPAARGVGIDDAGDIAGRAYENLDCGPFCLPPEAWLVWTGGAEVVLPTLPGFTGVSVVGINVDGWVAGTAGYVDTTAVLWRPLGGEAYELLDLGALPGHDLSYAVGVDDLGRVVGWSTTAFFPPVASPFVWTEATGMVALTDLGFPGDQPIAVSPGGKVATPTSWYQLGDPTSVRALAAPPRGFLVGAGATAINDVGEQVRFLVSTGPESLAYLYRYHTDGTWQAISPDGTGHLSRYGVGSIDAVGNATATVLSTGVFAPGPDGDAYPLSVRLSPAYGGSEVIEGGPQNEAGEMVSAVMIGRSARMARLTPAAPCTSKCLVVDTLVVQARFVEDPANPGHCTPDGPEHNETRVDLTVVDERGAPVSGARVSGRFMDDTWTNRPVSATSDPRGAVRFTHVGGCGVGAVAFVVEDAFQEQGRSTRTGTPSSFVARTLDKTTGILTGYAIPD